MKCRIFVLILYVFCIGTPLTSDFSYANDNGQCENPPEELGGDGGSNAAGAVDPNELSGPAGFGEKNYIQVGTILPYRIDFENDSGATAPAQQVDITNELDPNLDWSTFQLTEVGYGDTFIPVPPGTTQFEKTMPMTYLDVSFEVLVQAGIDITSGEVYAHFYSLDPTTGLPPAVEIGFLPPEDGTHRGMGHISYTINHAENIAENTEIRNIALIVFDMGEQIYTNQVDPHDPSQGTDPAKEALVTIDTTRPESSILHFENTTHTTAKVFWGGYDSGSGIAGYTIRVREASQLGWEIWQDKTELTEAEFTGFPGHTYEFNITSIDNVGFRELKDIAPESKLVISGLRDSDLDGVADDDDNCPDIANSDQADSDGDGRGDACDNDQDADGISDSDDNCPGTNNPNQEDLDNDGIGDLCDDDDDGDTIPDEEDNCPADGNSSQQDFDEDGMGDACDEDDDGDGINDTNDNCPGLANPDQADLDGDGQGDLCDLDDDGDSVSDDSDNCPADPNPDQEDLDGDSMGNVCDEDDDDDSVIDTEDNCPVDANHDQADLDADGQGDICDDDDDGDGVLDVDDNCPVDANQNQEDLDGDSEGNVCDDDDDGDGYLDVADNCPVNSNSDQSDQDNDGAGDICDICPLDADDDIDSDTICGDVDNCPVDANPEQLDLDQDNLGDICDPQTCGNNILETPELCDDGNFTEYDGCSSQCIQETDIAVTKAEVEWNKGLIKYKGTIEMPEGLLPMLVVPQGTVTVQAGNLEPIRIDEINFTVKGGDEKNWRYNGSEALEKFYINWKGEFFEYEDVIRMTANHISSDSTNLEIARNDYAGEFTIQVNGITIQVSADNAVTTTPTALAVDNDDADGEIEVDLPFALTREMTMILGKPEQAETTINIGDYFTNTTGTFDLRINFDTHGNSGLDQPAILDLRIVLGQVGYPGGVHIDSGWETVKDKEWKLR